jgi:hypothetical protein
MSNEWLLIVEGSRDGYGTGGVTSITSYSDGTAPTGTTVRAGLLSPVLAVISERLRPLDGSVEVSSLDFTLFDTNKGLSDQFGRTLDSTAVTFLTASVTTSATAISVHSTAGVTIPSDLWIGRECMRATGTSLGQLLVDRGRYGTLAQAHDVDATQAVQPRVHTHPCTMTGRRVRLYRVRGTVATLRWVGYVKSGPVQNGDGASFTIQCIHAWEQEAAGSFGSPTPAATLTGYDARAVRFFVENADRTKQATSAAPTYKAYPRDRVGAVRLSLGWLASSLTAGGASSLVYWVNQSGSTLNVFLQFAGFTRGLAVVWFGQEMHTASTTENSGVVTHRWSIPITDRGALVRTGFRVGAGIQSATVIRPHAGLLGSSSSPVAGSRSGVVLTPVLTGELDKDTLLELDPTGHSPAGPKANDSAQTELEDLSGAFTFRGHARLVPKDPTAATTTIAPDHWGATYAVDQALPMRSELRVTAEHWLDAARSILEDDSFASADSDSRNWSWSGYDAARANSRDDLGAVEYRANGNASIGQFITGEARLRGCCVSVAADGRLTLLDLRSPTLVETPAATITTSDWLLADKQRSAPSEDGLVTDVVFETPLRTMTLRDAVALGQYGAQTRLSVSTQSTRRDPRIAEDPIGYSMLALGKLLGRWRDELTVYSGTVPASRFVDSCALGAIVSFESRNALNGNGSWGFSGATAKRAVVVGRHEDTASNQLSLELLALPVISGFAPAARVASISGAVLTLASGYAGAFSDYAGSTQTGYKKTANDRGAGYFAPGYIVELVLRDTATHTVETATVASVDTAAGTITLTAAPSSSPTAWATLVSTGFPVDVVFSSWGSVLSAQRLFAAVADETTRTIGGTSDSPRKWAP